MRKGPVPDTQYVTVRNDESSWRECRYSPVVLRSRTSRRGRRERALASLVSIRPVSTALTPATGTKPHSRVTLCPPASHQLQPLGVGGTDRYAQDVLTRHADLLLESVAGSLP